MRYFGAATVSLGVQPSEAWLLTPQEFWAMYDFRKEVNTPEGDTPMTREEFEIMKNELRDAGKL